MKAEEKIKVLAKSMRECINALCNLCGTHTGLCPFTVMKCDPGECENAELFQKVGEIANEE